MKRFNFILTVALFFLLLIDVSFSAETKKDSINRMVYEIEKSGVEPLDRSLFASDEDYKEMIKTQYSFIKEEKTKILKDMSVAKNTCKIMGFNDKYPNKKRFKECVLEVWQTRLIGKQYVKMQNEINTQDENLNDILLAYDGGYVEKLNKSRKRQIKKNSYLRDQLAKVDYGTAVKYALGIAAAYYLGKTLAEIVKVKPVAKAEPHVHVRSYRCMNFPTAFGC